MTDPLPLFTCHPADLRYTDITLAEMQRLTLPRILPSPAPFIPMGVEETERYPHGDKKGAVKAVVVVEERVDFLSNLS